MIKITTDSTCDLPRELLERYNITVTPLGIIKAGKLYQDGVDTVSYTHLTLPTTTLV